MMDYKNCRGMGAAAWWLVIIGALNWLLVGLGMWFGGDWNVVSLIFGGWMWLEALIYVLVGLGALYLLFGKKESSSNEDSDMSYSSDNDASMDTEMM